MVKEYTPLFDEAVEYIVSSAAAKKTNQNSIGIITEITFPLSIRTRFILNINSITNNPRRH